jgi:hypothetical protein
VYRFACFTSDHPRKKNPAGEEFSSTLEGGLVNVFRWSLVQPTAVCAGMVPDPPFGSNVTDGSAHTAYSVTFDAKSKIAMFA